MHRISLLVPNATVERPVVKKQSFGTDIVLVRSASATIHGAASKWQDTMRTRCFLYDLHESGTFLASKSLEAAMYLQLLRLMYVIVAWSPSSVTHQLSRTR